ncbi:uncharacterized protein LOC119633081 [Glossina fuscipes]|uniref:Uncharacterized protein LOC119633081 n=2 Tax=Nemorhina TaxID=44051 RepID=A0A8U0WBB5_9MUSC|nr:uncharacterized protein LOC119633081 [Glossina fuscipes]
MKQEWSKSYLVQPQDHLQSHLLKSQKKFVPSYERESCPLSMSLLIGWEYARIWRKERDEFVRARVTRNKPKKIKNDYNKWLEKRKTKMIKTCGPKL